MANNFNLQYKSTAVSSPAEVELHYGASVVNGLSVNASLYAGSDFTPTHYKMWGVELVDGEGIVTVSGAVWNTYVNTRDIQLARHNDPQYAYVKFRDTSTSGIPETEVIQSNAVTFGFVDPVINETVEWETDFVELEFDSASVNVLKNDTYSTKVEFNKNNLDQLEFSGRDFSGLRLEPETIYINPSSEIGRVIGLDAVNYVTITKVLESAETPLIKVAYGDGYDTLTTFDQTIKTTVSGENAGRISNVNWVSATKTLTFDAYKFSTYGFCTIQEVEFTNDSQTGGYIGDTNTIKVYVQDTNGEPVESAPVTLSGSGDIIGTFQESMPVSTGANGIAEFNLDISSAGTAIFEGNVDDYYFTDPDLQVQGMATISGARSLFRQYEQIHRTYNYIDTVSGVNDSVVAEPITSTFSGTSNSVLEYDLNILRTLVKQCKGTSDWFSNTPTMFDPEDTDGVGVENNQVTLSSISGKTLDSKTILIAVNDSNSGNGFSITSGDVGFLLNNTLGYATPADRRGIPIFASTVNNGSYHDEGADDKIVGIDLINMETGSEFRDASGNIVYAKFHDGADYSGVGVGTDVYVKFYTDTGAYTTVPGDPSSILIVYPYRKVMSEVDEHEWVRTDFINSWEGDAAIVDQVSDLWSYTGASNNEVTPVWTSVSGLTIITDESSLRDGIDVLNDEFGDRLYTGNYISSGQLITDSLDALDSNMYLLSQEVYSGVAEKYVVVVASNISEGSPYQLPVGVSYTPNSDSDQQGANMDVYLDGQLLAASTGLNGINDDKDYSETDATHVVFSFDIYQYSNLIFQVRT